MGDTMTCIPVKLEATVTLTHKEDYRGKRWEFILSTDGSKTKDYEYLLTAIKKEDYDQRVKAIKAESERRENVGETQENEFGKFEGSLVHVHSVFQGYCRFTYPGKEDDEEGSYDVIRESDQDAAKIKWEELGGKDFGNDNGRRLLSRLHFR